MNSSPNSLTRPLLFLLLSASLACSGGQSASTMVAADATQGIDAAPSTEIIAELDLPYPPPLGGDGQSALLDIYYRNDNTPKQLLVFVHGGGWVSGDKSNLALAEELVPWFVDRGFVVAAPNFRLASSLPGPRTVSYTDELSDIAASLSWLKDNQASYGVTEPGMVLMGFSSGAHLVAMLATQGQYLEDAGLTQSDLSAVMSFDVHNYDVPFALQLMQGSVVEANIPSIEFLFGIEESEQLLASPFAYASSENVPPSLVISAEPAAEVGSHGYVSSTASTRYVDALQAAGHQATFQHFDSESHSSLVINFGREGHGPTAAVESFLGF